MRAIAGQPAFSQLELALQRQLRWVTEFTIAGDLDSALDALLDASALREELVPSGSHR